MMKRIGNLTDKISELKNIYLAYSKAMRGKSFKKEVLDFQKNFDQNINEIRAELSSGLIDVGHYNYFTIHDPKLRTICSASFKERVIHHALMNVCHDYFDCSLIDSTYATRRSKGVYAALDAAKKAAAKYSYVVKLDFRKYYDSIDHGVLKRMLHRKFKDAKLLSMFDRIIDSYSVSEKCGLPIGNLTSQYFANMYLSPLDHMAKEVCRVPVYIRYMDDILLFADSKKELKSMVDCVKNFSGVELGLNTKPPIYRLCRVGIPFLGYDIHPHYLTLSGRSKRRLRHKFTMYVRRFTMGVWDEYVYEEHILPLFAFSMHASSKCFRNDVLTHTYNTR